MGDDFVQEKMQAEEEFDNTFEAFDKEENEIDETQPQEPTQEDKLEGVADGEATEDKTPSEEESKVEDASLGANEEKKESDSAGDEGEQGKKDVLPDIFSQIEELANKQQESSKEQEPEELTLDAIQDEDIREHLQTFIEFYPEYADAVLTLANGDGDINKKFLKRVKEDGDIETILAYATKFEIDRIKQQVKNVFEENEKLKQFLQQRYLEEARRAMQAYMDTILSKHPDMEEILKDENKTNQLKRDILAWAENKPYRQYKEIERIVNNGTAEEVVKVLDMYKQEKGIHAPARQEPNKKEIQDAMAVKSATKTTFIPMSEPPRDDFDSTWDAITKQ